MVFPGLLGRMYANQTAHCEAPKFLLRPTPKLQHCQKTAKYAAPRCFVLPMMQVSPPPIVTTVPLRVPVPDVDKPMVEAASQVVLARLAQVLAQG